MGDIVATYDYVDREGALLFQVVRDHKKDFYPRRRNAHRDPGEPEWLWGLADAPRVLYRLPEVNAAVAFGHRIYVVEGEKDADTLAGLGLVATTNPGGVGMGWTALHTELIKGAREVVILPDNDEHGRKHAEKVKAALKGEVGKVRILALPDLPDKGDVSDWVKNGGDKEGLEKLASAGPRSKGWVGAGSLIAEKIPDVRWVVPGILARPSLCMVSGDADSFKSWSMTAMCICAALHYRWLNHFDLDAERSMLITADEDRGETRRKIAFLSRGMGLQEPELKALEENMLVWMDDLSFDDDASFDSLLEAVEDHRPDVIVVDHLRVCFDGNEDSSEFARKVKLRGRAIHRVKECGVVWMHHWRKLSQERNLNTARQRSRGSGGLIQSVDHHLGFERDPATDVAFVVVDRNKKGPIMPPFSVVARFSDDAGMADVEWSADAKHAGGSSVEPGKILQLLRQEPCRPWSMTELNDALPELHRNTIRNALRFLESKRLVLVEGKARHTTYRARQTDDWRPADPIAQSHLNQPNTL